MLINSKDKIILLQNPKTGGTIKATEIVNVNTNFIRRHVKNFFDSNKQNHIVTFPFHITYNELKLYLGDDFPNWTIYTMIRNPYNRVVSAINFKHKLMAQLYDENDSSFETILNLLEDHLEDLLEPQSRTIWFAAQSNWIGEGVNILKYESEEDWKFINHLLGIDNLPINIKPDYELSDETKARIKQIYLPYDKQIFDLYNL